jgi:4-hydroxy-tetrahydrodipicolinate reductase
MRIALLGYGKMGKTIEEILLEKGHEVVLRANSNHQATNEDLENVDIAIEFSQPTSAFHNISLCFDNRIPVVSGTTGWHDKMMEIKNRCIDEGQSFFYASNFSIGVNIFFAMNKRLAELLNQYSQYKVNINETHHINKLDAPSGTAITLAENIMETQKNYERWALKESGDNILTINSTRIGEVHGTHVVTYESQDDIIEIKHESKNRRGFALGAVLAAEFLYGKTGYFGMKDLLNL